MVVTSCAVEDDASRGVCVCVCTNNFLIDPVISISAFATVQKELSNMDIIFWEALLANQ